MFGFDLDGVLYPWHGHVYNWAVENLNLELTHDEFWKWPGGWFYQNRENLIVNNIVGNPLLYNKSAVLPEIHDAVWEIKELVGDVCYITGRPEIVRFDTKLWIERSHLPDPDNVFFTPSQFGAKLEIIQQQGCDFFVDDRLDYIRELLGHTQLFLVDKIWNENFEHETVTRIQDVTDIPAILEEA